MLHKNNWCMIAPSLASDLLHSTDPWHNRNIVELRKITGSQCECARLKESDDM